MIPTGPVALSRPAAFLVVLCAALGARCVNPALTNVCMLRPLPEVVPAAEPCSAFRAAVTARAVPLALADRPIDPTAPATAPVRDDFHRFQGVAVLVDEALRQRGTRCLEALAANPAGAPSFAARAIGFVGLERFSARVYYDPLSVLVAPVPGSAVPDAAALAAAAAAWQAADPASVEVVVFLFAETGYAAAPVAGTPAPGCPAAFAGEPAFAPAAACTEPAYTAADHELLAVTAAGETLVPIAQSREPAGYAHCQEEVFSTTGWQVVRALARYDVVRARFPAALLPGPGGSTRLLVRARPERAEAVRARRDAFRQGCALPGTSESLQTLRAAGALAARFAPFYFGMPADLSASFVGPPAAKPTPPAIPR